MFLSNEGVCPFEDWFDDLSDSIAQQRILARIARVRTGNFGDWKTVGGGVFEMRIDHGPGYRIYFGRDGATIVVLLIGGDKRTQARDIQKAKGFWNEYKEKEKRQEL
jgi:putative addiction module killer protein